MWALWLSLVMLLILAILSDASLLPAARKWGAEEGFESAHDMRLCVHTLPLFCTRPMKSFDRGVGFHHVLTVVESVSITF